MSGGSRERETRKGLHLVDVVFVPFCRTLITRGLWIIRDRIYLPKVWPRIELGENGVVRIIDPEVPLPLLDDRPQCLESSGLVSNRK